MRSQTIGEEIQLNVMNFYTLKMLLMLFSTMCFCWSQTKASRSNITVIAFVTVIKSFNLFLFVLSAQYIWRLIYL